MKIGGPTEVDVTSRIQDRATSKVASKQGAPGRLGYPDAFDAGPVQLRPLQGPPGPTQTPTPPWPKGPLSPSPTRNPDVATMQTRLVALGFLADPGGAAGIYGQGTREAVKQFQLANGLSPADGLASTATLQAMGSTAAASKATVQTAQQQLASLGYLASTAATNGRADAATQRAITNFQLANGLQPSGTLDPATRTALASPTALSSSAAVAGLRGEAVIGQQAGTAGPDAPPSAAAIAALPVTASVRQGTINCRGDASLSASVTSHFTAPATLTVTGPEKNGFFPVQAQDGTTGWVSAQTITTPARATDPRVDARLQALGYLQANGKTDDLAVANFQRLNGLPIGPLDQPTLDAMWKASALTSPHIVQFQDPRYNPQKSKTTGTTGGDDSCGPTSVAIALASLGLASIDRGDPQLLVNALRTDTGTTQGQTTGPGQLETAAKKNGAQPYEVDSMDEVALAVSRGDPVVLYGVPNHGGTSYNTPPVAADREGAIDSGANHWIAVVGYDAATKTYLVSDPLCRDGVVRLSADQLKTYVDFSQPSVALHRP